MLHTTDPQMRRLEGEYNNPVEAVESAILLYKLWQSKSPEMVIGLAYGSLLDMVEGEFTLDIQSIRDWSTKEFESLEKCPVCGDILPDKRNRYTLVDIEEDEYCSEYCAEKACYSMYDYNDELESEVF
jgi:hypothetical protein